MPERGSKSQPAGDVMSHSSKSKAVDFTDLSPMIRKLGGRLDKLEEVLDPLLNRLEELTNTLPLLDRAKLYVIATYSLESLLFAQLKLVGEDPHDHPIMTELKRVQQALEKIKAAEEAANPGQRPTAVNVEAATRMLKADLYDGADASNQELMSRLREKIAKEKALAAGKTALPRRVADDMQGSSSPASTASEAGGHPRKKQKAQGKGTVQD